MDNCRMPKNPKTRKYRNPIPTVDIILRKRRNSAQILMIRRGIPPFAGLYALPGGHVDYGETVEDAALRELKEECSVEARLRAVLGVYSDPERDPRGQRITTVFVADWASGEPKGASDAQVTEWVYVEEILRSKADRIAFDHSLILRNYAQWLKSGGKTTYWSSKKKG